MYSNSDMQEIKSGEQQNHFQSDAIELKTETLDETIYETEHILSNWEEPNANVRIKVELENIKTEPGRNFEVLHDKNSNNNIWPNLNDTNLQQNAVNVKWEIEEYDEASESSDYFIEQYIKTENNNENCLNQADSALFNQRQGYSSIKEDIELQDDCVIPHSSKKIELPFECSFCEYKTHKRNDLNFHLTVHEDPSKLLWYYCTKCSYKTRQKGHLRRHDLVHQQLGELELFTCAICSYKFKQKCTLKRHIYNVHTHHKPCKNQSMKESKSNDTYPVYKCNDCSYTTFKKGLLMSHLDKHKDVRDVTSLYICDTCSFSTKYRRNLRVHLETHKESQALQIYECKLCKFKTRMGYCLKRHFLSKKHLQTVGKPEEYCPRTMKLKLESDS